MSWLFSRVLVEEYSEANSLDGEPYAQLNVMPTQHPFWRRDRTMDALSLSRFGATSAVLTADHGEALLTSYLEDFHARISVVQGKVLALTENDPGFGLRWQELSMRYDHNTCSWKTHRCLWDEDLPECYLTLPKWGLMLNGVLWGRRMLEPHTFEKDVGLWPTPRKHMTRLCKSRLNLKKKHKSNLEEVVALEQGLDGGNLIPPWVEWLMGWPIQWTDLQPLEMDKFLHWQQQFGC